MTLETLTIATPELRFANEDEGRFSGYASVFGEVDSYGDTIKRGAYARTIREGKSRGGPSMFWNHNPDQPIGTWSDIVEDAKGLKVTGKLVTATTRGAETLALLKAGAVNGLSIGFRARKSERGPNGGRVLTDIDLVEISIVTLPAASKARVLAVRGAAYPVRHAAFIQAARRAALAIRG